MQDADSLWINANLATMAAPAGYGEIHRGAIAAAGGRITWVGPMEALPADFERRAAAVHDLGGRWVTPGLIDCHTHLVYGGSRAAEFEQRLKGASYEALLAGGGGILSTVRATRAATEDELVASAARRLAALQRDGVTTVEIKSGYGLDTGTELRMLRAARRLAQERQVDVCTTFLGAHALPPEFAGRSAEYIDVVCNGMLPAVAAEGLADAVDGFCEKIAFSPGEIRRVFDRARDLGLPVKLHADQLSDLGGAALAARYRALSADHLEYASAEGIAAMAESGTVAVLLPGAFYFLGETRVPPVETLRRAGVPIAIASDSNPGSSPVESLLLMLSMACRFFRLTPDEALAGVTRNAARALGLGGDRGTLEVGRRADFAIWDIDAPVDLAYAIGASPCIGVVKDGEPVLRSQST